MTHPFDRYAPYTDVAVLKEYSDRPLRKSKRVNTLKASVASVLEWGKAKGWQMEPVPWCAEGFFIDRPSTSSGQVDWTDGDEDTNYRRPALGKDLLHLLGHTYMQEAASMLPPVLLNPQSGETVLDMSAAPGSKTTQLSAMMNGTGVVIANDVQEKRLWTLKTAIHRLGCTNVIVTKKVGQWFAKNMTERFDRVLCDAPCTAQGTARKDSDALNFCSLDNIGKMAKLQRELLESAIHAAKVGGVIVYSTCTLTPEENEEVVAAMLERFEGKVEIYEDEVRSMNYELRRAIEDSHVVQKGIGRSKMFTAYRLWPQTYDTEGFFCAVFRKIAPTKDPQRTEAIRFQETPLPHSRQKEVIKYLEDTYGHPLLNEDDAVFERGEQLLLSTKAVEEFKLPVQNYALGVPMGKRLPDGRIRLDHDLATLRGHLATENIVDLDDDQLAALLDGKDTHCPPTSRGDIFLRHKDRVMGIGLAKEGVLKNRLPRWLVQKS